MIEMYVAQLVADAYNGMPIVLLSDSTKRRVLPIWIGDPEAIAISRILKNIKSERPMTHDLLLNAINLLGYKVKQIEINELSSSTYFATIRLVVNDPSGNLEETKSLDSRPSDAIALALRANAPIFVSAQVVAEGTIPADTQKDREESQEFKKFIDGLKASDFKIDKPNKNSDTKKKDKKKNDDKSKGDNDA